MIHKAAGCEPSGAKQVPESKFVAVNFKCYPDRTPDGARTALMAQATVMWMLRRSHSGLPGLREYFLKIRHDCRISLRQFGCNFIA